MTQLFLPVAINDYAEAYTTPETAALASLNRETNVKVELPVMLSGHLQGGLLQMFSHMIKPRRVLEIGTYTGYSAICLAQGLTDDGILHTIDINEELEEMCFRYFCKVGLEQKIVQHIGKAAQIIPELEGQFDLVFIDADKQNYSLYYDLVFDRVPVGGYILADNVLYDGEVINPANEQSKNARAIHAFNEKVKNDKRIEHVLLPVRDGIMIVRKTTD
ncbi:O-methyltransferase [Polluticoccus soli]|uniref:O-methyltransferase n=1 Tax=Polluticoccus soli TaxID=3034150 RepID=UPI0023E2D568|nr:O-methyltransferase [Flavipsychrobacter sp. JY13-12]